MVKPELIQYIKSEQASGKNLAEIKQALLSVGWQEVQINEAMGQSAEPAAPESIATPSISTSNPSLSVNPMVNPTIADLSKGSPLSTAQKPKKSLITLILIILLVVLLLGAGGTYAYVKYFRSTSNTNSNNITNNSDNTSNVALPGVSVDSDNDGLSDETELFYKTDANNPDTDGDGYDDKTEIDGGYNPNGSGKLDTTSSGSSNDNSSSLPSVDSGTSDSTNNSTNTSL